MIHACFCHQGKKYMPTNSSSSLFSILTCVSHFSLPTTPTSHDKMSLTSDELNYLLLRYMLESGT